MQEYAKIGEKVRTNILSFFPQKKMAAVCVLCVHTLPLQPWSPSYHIHARLFPIPRRCE